MNIHFQIMDTKISTLRLDKNSRHHSPLSAFQTLQFFFILFVIDVRKFYLFLLGSALLFVIKSKASHREDYEIRFFNGFGYLSRKNFSTLQVLSAVCLWKKYFITFGRICSWYMVIFLPIFYLFRLYCGVSVLPTGGSILNKNLIFH